MSAIRRLHYKVKKQFRFEQEKDIDLMNLGNIGELGSIGILTQQSQTTKFLVRSREMWCITKERPSG